MIDAQENLAKSRPDGDAEELERLRNRARQAREREKEIDGVYSQVEAAKLAIRIFDIEKRRPSPDWQGVADRLKNAGRTDEEGVDAFALTAQKLANDRLREAESLDFQRMTEARRKEENRSAARQQEQTVAERKQTKEKGLSRDPEKSQGRSMGS